MNNDLALPFLIGIGVCGISIVCASIVAYLDYISDKREGKLKVKNEEAGEDRVKCDDVKKFSRMFWGLCGIVVFSDGTTWTLYTI